jgi:hypothetical protein
VPKWESEGARLLLPSLTSSPLCGREDVYTRTAKLGGVGNIVDDNLDGTIFLLKNFQCLVDQVVHGSQFVEGYLKQVELPLQVQGMDGVQTYKPCVNKLLGVLAAQLDRTVAAKVNRIMSYQREVADDHMFDEFPVLGSRQTAVPHAGGLGVTSLGLPFAQALARGIPQ